ncbi:hypothetical protein COV18_05450 [Candidatus Woesearchaeota archaeon CG10_big_fil_rev_8_21_14_0_10_37_12]|nr:MAG: hypothetical protein COV18_05450 [Candidatus Woesearchaeota archaeon CG10_big_fil_rev_8_21_14_0_10_37_12]
MKNKQFISIIVILLLESLKNFSVITGKLSKNKIVSFPEYRKEMKYTKIKFLSHRKKPIMFLLLFSLVVSPVYGRSKKVES